MIPISKFIIKYDFRREMSVERTPDSEEYGDEGSSERDHSIGKILSWALSKQVRAKS